MIKKEDLVKSAREILAASPFQETEIAVKTGQASLTRYGGNKITQNVDRSTNSVSLRAIVRSSDGPRTARVDCDQLDRASVARAYERLRKILDVIPAADEVTDLVTAGGKYAAPDHLGLEVPEPEVAAKAIERAAQAALQDGFEASGTFSSEHHTLVYANSKGLELVEDLSDSEFACTIEGREGAGRGFSHHSDSKKLDVDGAIARAYQKCKASSSDAGKLVGLEPGAYDVVLEPAALAEILVYFGWMGLSAKAYLEDRLFCKGKLGQKLFNERISIVDDPLNPKVAGAFFDGQGVAKRRTVFIENGILRELASDLKTAARLERQSTGHGMSEPNSNDPVPWNIGLEWSGPMAKNTEELVASVDRGILVTQFHYANVVDVMVPSLTGMTRNGAFLIEKGKITRAIRNMRFTQSMIELFDNVEGVSQSQERVSTFFGGASLCPSVLVRKFNFSSGTEF